MLPLWRQNDAEHVRTVSSPRERRMCPCHTDMCAICAPYSRIVQAPNMRQDVLGIESASFRHVNGTFWRPFGRDMNGPFCAPNCRGGKFVMVSWLRLDAKRVKWLFASPILLYLYLISNYFASELAHPWWPVYVWSIFNHTPLVAGFFSWRSGRLQKCFDTMP